MVSKTQPPIILGLIHAEWCGHCKNLQPHWKELTNDLKNNNQIQIVSIEASDSDKETKLSELNAKITDGNEKLQENGYPTVFLIQDGKLIYNNNDRTYESLSKWVKNYTSQRGGKRSDRKRSDRKRIDKKKKSTSRRVIRTRKTKKQISKKK